MHIAVKHNTTQAQAIGKVGKAIMDARRQPQFAEQVSDFESAWKGHVLEFSLKVQGNKISGTLDVTDSEFIFDAKLPLLWRMFEGRIEKAVKEQIAATVGQMR